SDFGWRKSHDRGALGRLSTRDAEPGKDEGEAQHGYLRAGDGEEHVAEQERRCADPKDADGSRPIARVPGRDAEQRRRGVVSEVEEETDQGRRGQPSRGGPRLRSRGG